MRRSSPGVLRSLGLLAGFLVTSVVAGVLAAGLVMPLVGASGSAARSSVAFFDSLPSELVRKPLAQQSRLLAADGSLIAYFYDENRISVPLAQIAPRMQEAIVAIEDSRFYQHGGIDPRGVLRALVNNQSGGSTQGASTLTQQYVKNVLLEEAVAAGDQAAARAAVVKSTARKLREIKLAISLEKQLSKQQILEGYLNIAYFGEKTYGIEAASELYFGHSASKLSLSEAATLAGMVQAPATYDPKTNNAAATQRRNVVLARMLDLGMITKTQHDAAAKGNVVVHPKKPLNGCANAGIYGYFCDYVERWIVDGPDFTALGKTPDARRQALFRDGLTIRTTLDPTLEAAAKKAVDKKVPPKDKSGLGAAAVTVEPGTGQVKAMTQNRTYSPSEGRGLTSINYSTDGAYGGSSGFQTGSTFKAFTLATWLKDGRSLNATLDGTPRPFAAHDFSTCGGHLTGKAYFPHNAADGSETGPMSVISATYNSVNVAFVDMESQLDLCDVASTAESMGVHLAKPDNDCGGAPSLRLPRCVASLTLGVLDISPLTMAAAYATFADGGVYCKPIVVTSILRPGPNGGQATPVAVPKSSCKQVLDSDVAAAESFALEQVLTRGTAQGVGPLSGHPSAGKTGTTDGPHDSWFVGYTAQRATAVWVADPGHMKNGQLVRKQLTGLTVGGRHYGTIFGATIAAPIWKSIMTVAMRGLPREGFGQVSGSLLVSDGVTVPDVRGDTVGQAIIQLQAAGFQVVTGGAVPSRFPPSTVAGTQPGAGSRAPRGSTVVILLSAGRLGGNGGGNGNGGPGQG